MGGLRLCRLWECGWLFSKEPAIFQRVLFSKEFIVGLWPGFVNREAENNQSYNGFTSTFN
jgi:hypothetical protein